MDRSGFRPSPLPMPPGGIGSPADNGLPTSPATPIETKAGPKQVTPASPDSTPLTRRLLAWERDSTRPAPAQGLRPSSVGQGETPIRGLDDMEVVAWSPIDPDALAAPAAGPRRLNLDGSPDVRDPRIRHLADSTALSDDEDADVTLPPAPMNGVSPDTSFQVSDPAFDALWTAVNFRGASAGLGAGERAALLHDPQVREHVLGAMGQALAAQGFAPGSRVPDRVMAQVADDAARLLLNHTDLTDAEPTPPPPDDEAPSFDELQSRLDALLAQAPLAPPDSPDASASPADRKSGPSGQSGGSGDRG